MSVVTITAVNGITGTTTAASLIISIKIIITTSIISCYHTFNCTSIYTFIAVEENQKKLNENEQILILTADNDIFTVIYEYY
jgi:hypothetical protein